MIITFTNVIGAIRNAISSVITTNLKMWLGFETSETIGKNIYDGGIVSPANGGTFTDNGNGTFTVTGDGSPNVGIGVRDIDADYLTVGGTYKFSAQGANTTLGVYNSSFSLLTSGVGSVEFQATTTSIKLYISPTNGVSATYSDVEVKELTQITPDKSGNNNVGELFTGKALEFDGNGDSVTFTSYPTSIKSVVFWYKPLANESFDSIIWLGGTSRGTIAISNNQGTINCTNLLGKVIYVNGVQTESVTLNQWQRVVINFPSKTLLGLSFAKVGLNYGDCQLSDVQFYNEDLSLDDIAYDYANPQNLLTDRDGTSVVLADLRGYWALSEGAGSIVYDSSGGNHNGTISGATHEPAQPRIPQLGMMNWAKSTPVADEVTLIANPSIPTQDILGNAVRDRLNSFNLDGSGWAEVADDASINPTTEITVQCWIQSNTENAVGLVSKWNSSVKDYMLFKLTQNFRFYIGVNYGQSDPIPTSGWVNIAGTYDGSNIKTYINGLLSTTTALTGPIPNNSNTLDIGKYNSNFGIPYSERISDVLLYDTALSATKIKNNYNAGLSAHTN